MYNIWYKNLLPEFFPQKEMKYLRWSPMVRCIVASYACVNFCFVCREYINCWHSTREWWNKLMFITNLKNHKNHVWRLRHLMWDKSTVCTRKSESDVRNEKAYCFDVVAKFPLPADPALVPYGITNVSDSPDISLCNVLTLFCVLMIYHLMGVKENYDTSLWMLSLNLK